MPVCDLRVLNVHAWLVAWGGAERTLAEMLNLFPDADLAKAIGVTAGNPHLFYCYSALR